MHLNETTVKMLVEKASTPTFRDVPESDDPLVVDYANGNVDDAFELGEYAGETQLAREILDALGVAYTVKEN